MIRFLLLTCLLAAPALTSYSQGANHSDLTGDWILNVSASKVSKGTSRDVLRAGTNTILRIDYREPKFQVSTIIPETGEVVTSSIFYTDGREVKTDDGRSIEKTKWEGRKLVMRRTPSVKEPDRIGSRRPDGTVVIGGGTVKTEMRIEWELLTDGRLTETVRRTTRSEMQILKRTEIKQDKTEIVKVFDRVKGS
jgi:hypothetical protein